MGVPGLRVKVIGESALAMRCPPTSVIEVGVGWGGHRFFFFATLTFFLQHLKNVVNLIFLQHFCCKQMLHEFLVIF